MQTSETQLLRKEYLLFELFCLINELQTLWNELTLSDLNDLKVLSRKLRGFFQENPL